MAANTSRNTNKLTRGTSSQNKSASSPAASATHAVSVPTKPPTGIEPASDSKSRRDRPNVVSRGEGEVLSCVPPDAERDTYLLLDDFGGDWFAWRETPKALIAPRRSRICWTSSDDGVQMANNMLNRAPRITACDTGAGVNYCAHASARPRRSCSTRRARSTAME